MPRFRLEWDWLATPLNSTSLYSAGARFTFDRHIYNFDVNRKSFIVSEWVGRDVRTQGELSGQMRHLLKPVIVYRNFSRGNPLICKTWICNDMGKSIKSVMNVSCHISSYVFHHLVIFCHISRNEWRMRNDFAWKKIFIYLFIFLQLWLFHDS